MLLRDLGSLRSWSFLFIAWALLTSGSVHLGLSLLDDLGGTWLIDGCRVEKLGYLVGTAIFAVIFLVAVVAQISAKKFHPFVYWITIVATTTVGTTLADFADRSLGIGYTGGTVLLLTLLLASLFIWHRIMGSIAIDTVSSPKAEMFYWVTIMFSQTLGTALGDWTADSAGMGYLGAAAV